MLGITGERPSWRPCPTTRKTKDAEGNAWSYLKFPAPSSPCT
ncbi:MAG: hypothetical protein R3F43_11280 [bacterium]